MLLDPKNNNKNNHRAACKAVIKVLFSFQQGFTPSVAVLHSEKQRGRLPQELCRCSAAVGCRPASSAPRPRGRHRTFGLHRNQARVISVEISSLQPHPLQGKFSPGRRPRRDTPWTCSKIPAAKLTPERRTPRCCCLVTQSCLTPSDPVDCSPPGSSVHVISQARILERVVISSSRESS